jgi:hypothetical protein
VPANLAFSVGDERRCRAGTGAVRCGVRPLPQIEGRSLRRLLLLPRRQGPNGRRSSSSLLHSLLVELLLHLHLRASLTSEEAGWRENTMGRGLRPPPFFRTWLRELLERLQCRSTPLFLVADSFPGASVESLREGCKIVILSILNSSSKITLKLKL